MVDDQEAAPFYAVLSPESPRAPDWQADFGSLRVPILDPLPHIGSHARFGLTLFYRLDVARIGEVARERLIGSLMTRFGLPREAVVRGLDDPDHGLPLVAEGITVEMEGGTAIGQSFDLADALRRRSQAS